jgi:hypothetical protein
MPRVKNIKSFWLRTFLYAMSLAVICIHVWCQEQLKRLGDNDTSQEQFKARVDKKQNDDRDILTLLQKYTPTEVANILGFPRERVIRVLEAAQQEQEERQRFIKTGKLPDWMTEDPNGVIGAVVSVFR